MTTGTNGIGAPRNHTIVDPLVDKAVENRIAKEQGVQNPIDINVPPPEEKKEGNSKLMNALTGLAVIGAGAMLLYNLRKGKAPEIKTLEKLRAEGFKFEKGIAKLADGSEFTGVFKHTTKTGDNFFILCENGKITKSAKNVDLAGFADPTKGANNFIKSYGEKGVEEIKRFKEGEWVADILAPKKNIKMESKFLNEGGYFVDDIPYNADGSAFEGFISKADDIQGTLIKEYKGGKQVSERLNTGFTDKPMGGVEKPGLDYYVMNEADIVARENARIAEEIRYNKWYRKLGRAIKNFFTPNKTKTPTS